MRPKPASLSSILFCLSPFLSLRAQENGAPPPGTRKVEEAPVEGARPPRPRSPWADIQREAAAMRVPKGPVVDGRLGDEVWKLATVEGPLVQAVPFEGTEPSQRTEFRVLYDDDALYVGLWCFDDHPEGITASEMAHDGRIYGDDYIVVVLDTFLDRRNGYEFRVNPNGARGESLISDNVNLNESWDCIWTAEASIDSEGWKAELAIPFKSLSFDPHSVVWGLNVLRYIHRSMEKDRWVAARAELSTYNVADAGTLKGLTGLKQGVGLDVTPYALGKFSRNHETRDDDLTSQFGGDARYRIMPNLTAILSYNTDFAETEADARQINLTRFPLFFPEKRSFFLEDSGIFRFGGLGTSLMPFFSRRIGLSESGEVVPIQVAGKVTGRASDFNIGALDALIEEHDDVGARNVFVGRLSKNVLEQSSIGAIATVGDPGSDRENVLGGADFSYRTTSLLGDNVLQGSAFVMGTSTEGQGGDGLSAGASLSMPNDLYNASLQFYQVDEEFHPALGFAPRRGIRAYLGSFTWQPRPERMKAVRQLFFVFSNSWFTDLSNELETASQTFSPLSVLFESGDLVYFSLNGQMDAPREDFEIHPGVVIPPDDYWWSYFRAGFYSSDKRPVELQLDGSYGDFYEGKKSSYSAAVDLKPIKYVVFRLSWSQNQVRLPEGDFDTSLGSARMRISITPDLAWYNLAQYDSSSETVGYQSRIVWEFRPGARLFVVLNQDIDREEITWLESELTVKLGVTFRF